MISKWVSVKDEMPAKRKNVLISNGEIIGHAKLLDYGFSIVASNDPVPFYQVTHWMELPPLPEAL